MTERKRRTARKQQTLGWNQTDDRVAGPATDLEPDIGNAPDGTKKAPRFCSSVRVHFHSVRKRLADVDGLSGKAAIDGLVIAGILADDSAKQVSEVTYSQAKGQPEKTIITIEEITTG